MIIDIENEHPNSDQLLNYSLIIVSLNQTFWWFVVGLKGELSRQYFVYDDRKGIDVALLGALEVVVRQNKLWSSP